MTVAAKSGQFTADETGKGQFLRGNRRFTIHLVALIFVFLTVHLKCTYPCELIGVGEAKQTLSVRRAAYACGLNVDQVSQLTQTTLFSTLPESKG